MTDVTKSRIYLGIIAALAIVIAWMGYKFIVAGSAVKAEDGRATIMLEPAERALLLHEMRDFVVGLQAVADGLARDDMKAVAKASRAMGMAHAHDVPAAMVGKLPLEFKTLGFGLHRAFDRMAMDAADIAMPRHTLGQLADALQKCVACHNTYQVRSPQTALPGR
jgi:hypothetical protein